MAFGYAGTRIMKVIAQVQYQIHWQTALPPHPFVGAEFLMIHNNGTKFNAVKNWKRIFPFETGNPMALKDALSDIFLFWTCKQTYIWIDQNEEDSKPTEKALVHLMKLHCRAKREFIL